MRLHKHQIEVLETTSWLMELILQREPHPQVIIEALLNCLQQCIKASMETIYEHIEMVRQESNLEKNPE